MKEPNKNPWDVQSIYDLHFFNCPSCEFKDFSKQDFINHAHLSHFGAIKYLMNIKDGSLDDIVCPWNHQPNENKFEQKNNDINTNEFKLKTDIDENNFEENNDNQVEIHQEEEDDNNTNHDSSFYFEDESNEIDMKTSIIIPQIDKTKCKLTVQLERIQLGYYECGHCEKIFEYEPLLNIHCREYHDIKNKEIHMKKTEMKSDPSAKISISRKNGVQKNNNFGGGISYLCNKCSKSFNSAHALMVHECSVNVKKENIDSNTMTEYLRKKDVKQNESIVHEVPYKSDKSMHEGKGITSYKCDHCSDLEFRLKEDLRKHNLRIHNIRDHSCTFGLCTKTFGRRSELNKHIRYIHEGIKIMCESCGKSFGKPGDLDRHIKAIHEAIIHECDKCDRKYLKKRDLEYHISSVHEGKGINSYKCDQCPDMDFRLKEDLRKHNLMIHNIKDNACHLCVKTFGRRSELNKHIRYIHQGIKQICEYCSKSFGKPGDLNRHIKAIHEGIMDYKCEKCGKEFSQSRYLTQHINVAHESPEKTIRCGIDNCDYATHNKSNLNKHVISIHEKPKELCCETCGKQCGSMSDLRRHVKAVHTKIKDNLCDKCEYASVDKIGLMRHIKRVHEGLKNFQCTYCSKTFFDKPQLSHHVVQYHEQDKKLCCETCGKQCATKGNLKVHIDSVHKKIKKHQCSKCEKSFFQGDKLKVHYDFIHEGIKNFKCDKCLDKKFGTPDGLTQHIKIFHLGQKNHKCHVCVKEFGNSSHLKRHMTTHEKHPRPHL